MKPQNPDDVGVGASRFRVVVPVTALVVCLSLVTAIAEHSDDYLATFDLGFNPTSLGLINAVGACAFLVGVPVAWAVNRWGRSPVLLFLVCTVGVTAGVNYVAWSHNRLGIGGLLVGAGVCALLQVAASISLDSWWPSLVGHKRAEELFARSQFIDSIVSVGLPLGVGALLIVGPTGALLLGVAAAATLTATCLVWLQTISRSRQSHQTRRVDQHSPSDQPNAGAQSSTEVVSAPSLSGWAGIKLLFTSRVLVVSLVASTLLNGSYAFLFGFYFMALARFGGLSQWWVGFALACQSVSVLAATGFAGWFSRNFTPRWRLTVSGGLLAIAAVCCVLSSTIGEGFLRQILLVTALSSFAAGQALAVVAIYGVTVPLIPEEVRVTVQGARMSVAMSLVPVALLLGAGVAQMWGFAAALVVWAGLLLLSIGAVSLVARLRS